MFDFDTTVFLWLNATSASPAWLISFARFSSLELPQWILAGAAGALIVGDAHIRRLLLRAIFAMAVAWILARLVQHAVPMRRPFFMGVGTAWVPHGDSAGFPSTHASVAFAFAAAICASVKQAFVRSVAIAAACVIAWSRVCLGLHFPFDVVVGAGVGVFSAWICGKLAFKLAPALAAHE